MELLDFAFIAPVVAKHISKALRAKNADDRRKEVLACVTLLIATYREDEEFMATLKKVVK